MSKRISKVFIYSFIAFSVFSLFRLAIYLNYPSEFSRLSTEELLLSFFTGLRVDAITIFTFTSLLILLILIPAKWAGNLHYQRFLSIVFYLLLIAMASALYGDFLYFEHVHRHTSSEVLYLGEDASVALEPLKAHWQTVLGLLFFYLGLLYVFWKVPEWLHEQASFSLKNLGLFIIIFIFLFAAIRGKVIGKPFGIVDAFSSNNVASGHLALNGIYSVYRSSSRDGKAEHFMEPEQALKITREQLADPAFEFSYEGYPLVRSLLQAGSSPFKSIESSGAKPNIVIFLLEGWSSLYIDSYADLDMQVTPNFDSLAKEGIKFTNFYANGQRSIDGITALFTGIPRVAGINRLGSGLEISEVSFLGDLAKQNGYKTLAMQSSKRSSFRLDSITRLAGFEDYYGAEDIPQLNLESSGKQPYFGTWDNNTFQFLLQTINDSQDKDEQPFLAFAFSSTTHTPFISPGEEWEKYAHDENSMYGFLNTLYYADDVLGQFMDKARQQSWFDNTVFIFMADHTVGFGDPSFFIGDATVRENESMRIPLLIYAPKLLQPAIYEKPASQADIMPTLVHLLNWKGSFSAISNSLFSDSARFALLNEGPIITYIKEDGYLKHNLDKSLSSTFQSKHAEKEKEFLAMYQTLSSLLHDNRFFDEKNPVLKVSYPESGL